MKPYRKKSLGYLLKKLKPKQIGQNLTKYLDSAHDTILTATRALNDVTGYSAIEKLKNQ